MKRSTVEQLPASEFCEGFSASQRGSSARSACAPHPSLNLDGGYYESVYLRRNKRPTLSATCQPFDAALLTQN